MGISINGPSGIDTAYIIDSLVSLEKKKVKKVQGTIDAYQLKIDAYAQLKGLLSAFVTSASALDKEDDFNVFTTKSGNEDLVTFRIGAGAVEGAYNVGVYQLASAEKMISADNLITSQSSPLSSFGITPGDISINGVSITIDDDDTIQDLRMKINSAVDAKGQKIGVTATVLKISDTNFRLLLTAANTGSAGATYQDLTGNVLQGLGIIQDAAGVKGNTYQTLESAVDVRSAFAGLAIGETIEFSGTDRSGNVVRNVFIKRAASTVDDFLAQVKSTFRGMADASIDAATGRLVVTDKVAGSSQLTIGSFSIGGASSAVSVTEAGDEGPGVLAAGRDAFYSIDGIFMQADTNSPAGVVAGVTMDFHKASATETVRLEMSRDLDGIVGKIKDLFNQFNAIVRFANEKTKYSTSEEKTADGETKTKISKGDLAGDTTVRTIVSKFRTLFQQQFNLTGSSLNNLALIGIKTDPKTGEISVDEEKMKSAIENDFNGVMSMFITKGYSDNANITLGRYTKATASGRYVVEEIDADHLRMRLESATEWFLSDARMGDLVPFSNGMVAGLTLTAPAGSVGTPSLFTFSKGLADQVKELAEELNDGRDGLIFMRQESWRKSIERSNDRIDRLERSIEDYRLRLVKQFSDMERNLSQIQTQSGNMLSALGYSRK